MAPQPGSLARFDTSEVRDASEQPLRSLVDRIALRINRSRQPRSGDVRLTQRLIYILPSKAGLLFAMVLFAMLSASMNYQLSLGYALTFWLAAAAIVAIFHTFRNLVNITLKPGRVEAVFAGQIAEFGLMLINNSSRERHAIRMLGAGMSAEVIVDLQASAEQLATIALTTHKRGWLAIPRIKLFTRYPIGLWCAWAYWYPGMRALVYPAPESPAAPLPEFTAVASDGNGRGKGEDDIAAIRPYQFGDSIRRVAWKAVARTASDQLLTKQFDGGDRGELMFDWMALPAALDVESRLSRLTRWIIDAENSGIRYSLRIPGQMLDLDHGAAHRQKCLEALALFQG
jgi:uncharacterized protein (DUF58 family)